MDVLNVVRRGRFFFPIACIAAAAMVLISETAHWQSKRALSEMGVILEARVAVRNLVQGVADAEAGQRGYLLTGRQDYREPYDQALQSVEAAFQYLDRYYANQPVGRERLARMHEQTQAKLSELALTIRMRDDGRARASMELVLSGIGKEKMDDVRTLGAEMIQQETRNIATRQNDIYRTLLLSRMGIALLCAVGLVGLFIYLRQNKVLGNQQREQQRLLRAERDRLEVEVSLRTAELTELALHLQTAREDERNRLARNLHDELGALLTSAKLDAARIKSRLGGGAPEALELLTHLVGTLNGSIALGRRIIEDLRPSALGNLGLVATLEILAREYAERSGVQVHCTLEPVALRPEAELIIYRVVQEAMTNITKYARAGNVWIDLAPKAGHAQVSVRDDGAGFDISAKTISAYGLMGMRFRVESEGGSLSLQSTPGQGTWIQATLPLAPPAPT